MIIDVNFADILGAPVWRLPQGYFLYIDTDPATSSSCTILNGQTKYGRDGDWCDMTGAAEGLGSCHRQVFNLPPDWEAGVALIDRDNRFYPDKKVFDYLLADANEIVLRATGTKSIGFSHFYRQNKLGNLWVPRSIPFDTDPGWILTFNGWDPANPNIMDVHNPNCQVVNQVNPMPVVELTHEEIIRRETGDKRWVIRMKRYGGPTEEYHYYDIGPSTGIYDPMYGQVAYGHIHVLPGWSCQQGLVEFTLFEKFGIAGQLDMATCGDPPAGLY